MTPIQEPREVELPRGVVAEASAPLPVIQFPDGSTEPAPASSVLAENIIGQLTSEQIAELEATKISGKLTAEQIESIHAAQIVGQIVSEQIQNLAANKITGELEAAQIKELPTNKLTGFITNAQIKELEAAKITGEIQETQIGNESITTPKLKALAVTAAKIAAGSIVAEKIAAEAVEANAIKALAITAGKVAAGAIIAEKIGAEAVEATKIKALAVTSAKIAAEAIIAEKIAAGAITTAKLAAEAITAEKISASAITTTKLAAGAVTAAKLSVVELSAISANLGTVTAGTINALTAFNLVEGTAGGQPASSLTWGGGSAERITSYFEEETHRMDFEIANANGPHSKYRFMAWGEPATIVGKKGGFAMLEIDAKTGGTFKIEYSEKNAANRITKTIFEQTTGKSSWVQILGSTAKNIQCLTGLVQSNGTIIFGTGFTVSHPGTGEYKITMNPGMVAGYAVTGSDAQNAGRVFSYTTLSSSEFSVTMRNGATLGLENIAFSFIVIGSE